MDRHSADFKKLQAEWYKKLEQSGFEDIEEEDGSLKERAARYASKYNGTYFQAKKGYYESVEEYYRLATQFLHSHRFKNKREKLIWEMHSNGTSIRNIVKELEKRQYPASKRDSVHKVVKGLAAKMKKKQDAENGQTWIIWS